ncbi:helix-turn-helix domain-containing protein [Azospirillum sp.]|uniref:helix-turn-helix domain-containing protein n=1 Tax=Azospirillum sp. TaxID=34012 RepID=UPI003D70F3AD
MTTTIATDFDSRRWGRIPAWWLDHPDLDADGFAVLSALATFADEHGVCWPSQSTLATKLKRSRPTINRILQRLDDLGLVSIEHRRGRDGARLSCLYRLRFTHDGAAAEPRADPAAAAAMNRDDSAVDAPCPLLTQEQVHFEQIPDSHASSGCEPMLDMPVQAVPAEWMPNPEELAWAQARFGHVDLAQHVDGFVLRCRAHGYRYRDIGAAWRAWLTQDAAAGKAPTSRGAPLAGVPAASPARPRETAAEQRLGAWAAAAAELRQRRATPFRT